MKRRILLWAAGPVLLLVLIAGLAGAAWYALESERGLRTLAALAQHYSGGSLRIGAVQGRLLGEFVLDEVHYTGADGLRIDLKRAHLRLVPDELLHQHRLHLEVAELQDLELHLPPPAPSTANTQPSLPARLPVDVVIDAFGMDSFKLYSAGAAEPFSIEQAALKGSWIGDQLNIQRLNATLALTGPLQLDGQAQMSSDHVDIAALHLQGPGTLEAKGRYGLGRVPSQLQLAWKQLRWPFTAAAPERLADALDGSASVDGTLDDYRFELQTAAVVHQLNLKLAAKGQGSVQQVQLADLSLNAGKGSARLQGSVAWEPALRADLRGTLSQVDPALFAAGWSGSLNGQFDTHTTIANGRPDIAFNLKIDQSQLRGHPLSLAATGDTDTRGVQLKQLLLQSGKGSVSASGSAGWSPALRVDLKAQLRNFDPSQFAAAFPGSINGSVSTATTQQNGQPLIAFNVAIAQSTLRGKPLQLDAAASLHGEIVDVQKLELALGQTRLSASGQATPPFKLSGKLDSPDLSSFEPQLGGRVSLAFDLQGTLDDPHLVSKGGAQGLRYQAYRIARLDWDADLDPKQQSHLNLSATDADAGIAIHSLKLELTGLEVYHHAQFDISTERGDASLSLNGGYDRNKREWGGELSAGRFAPDKLSPWTLEKGAGLLLGAQRQSLEPACFAGSGGRACLRLEQNVTGAGLRLSLDLQHLLLAAFQPLLPPKYQVDGEIDGSCSIELAHNDITAVSADLHSGPIRIQAPQAPPVQIESSSLKADDRQNSLHAALEVTLAQGSLSADLSAAPAADLQARPLSGQLRMTVPDLGFVQSFVPQLQSVKGSIEGELQFGGSIGLPRLQGQIALKDGGAKVAAAGIELQQVQLSLKGQGEGPLALDGSLSSGGGSLAIQGTIDPSLTPPRADLKLSGANFQALAITDGRIWVTPDLHLSSDAGGMHLEGSLTVPKADITPQGFGNSGVAVSEDQVIVGAAPAPQNQPLRISSVVTVKLGDAVNFKGFGLTTRLTGGVTVNEAPSQLTTGQGELQLVEGRYQAYGQDLTIQTGRLIFDGGPITKPAVDLYATRHPQSDITVGVRVRGTLDKPMLTLESEPAMPREQQLSWLVLGRSLDQSSSSDSSAISNAALSLGLSGGDYFAQKLSKSVGLDTISVGQGAVTDSDVTANPNAIQGSQSALNSGNSTTYSSQAAQLTLGKYLTPKLFVSYGVSLFQPGQTFRLLYDIGHGFKLQTESGVASGADLLYTFERGH
jgi:translocation and assembly module TamB